MTTWAERVLAEGGEECEGLLNPRVRRHPHDSASEWDAVTCVCGGGGVPPAPQPGYALACLDERNDYFWMGRVATRPERDEVFLSSSFEMMIGSIY